MGSLVGRRRRSGGVVRSRRSVRRGRPRWLGMIDTVLTSDGRPLTVFPATRTLARGGIDGRGRSGRIVASVRGLENRSGAWVRPPIVLRRRGCVLALLTTWPTIRVKTPIRLVGVTGHISGVSTAARGWMGRRRCSAWERVEDGVRRIELLLGTVAPRPSALGT